MAVINLVYLLLYIYFYRTVHVVITAWHVRVFVCLVLHDRNVVKVPRWSRLKIAWLVLTAEKERTFVKHVSLVNIKLVFNFNRVLPNRSMRFLSITVELMILHGTKQNSVRYVIRYGWRGKHNRFLVLSLLRVPSVYWRKVLYLQWAFVVTTFWDGGMTYSNSKGKLNTKVFTLYTHWTESPFQQICTSDTITKI